MTDLLVRPAWRFTRTLVFDGSILDGRHGVIDAGLDASATFFKYAHLWELEQRPAEPRGTRTA